MGGAHRAVGRPARRSVAAAGAAVCLLAIPAVSAYAAPTPSPTPAATAPAKSGLSIQLGSLGLKVPLALAVPGLLEIGSAADETTSPPPTSTPPSTTHSSPTPPTRPPTSTHHTATPPSSPTGTAVAPPPAGQFNPPPSSQPSSSHHATHPTTPSTSPTKERRGTGSLVLRQLDNGGQVLLAVLLALTAVAVVAFARLGGIRRRKPGRHQT